MVNMVHTLSRTFYIFLYPYQPFPSPHAQGPRWRQW